MYDVDETERDTRAAGGKVRYSTGEKYCAERIFFLHGAVNTVFCKRELAPT
jgi:hypothetical protein